jgi:hypothetical protein
MKTQKDALLITYVSLFAILLSSACSAFQSGSPIQPSPSPLQATPPAALKVTDTATPAPDTSTEVETAPATQPSGYPIDPATGWKIYTNETFGLSFSIPPAWYGPDEYAWEDGVRLEVGSDVVYPYGTSREDQIYEVENSYFVRIQYTLNRANWNLEEFRANQPWTDTYFSLLDLRDGESLSSPRSLVTRVRGVELGGFKGVEYVATLPDTAQTERFYVREVALLDENFNTLTITGYPNNVQVPNPETWRETYRQVDEVNLETFYNILESISME